MLSQAARLRMCRVWIVKGTASGESPRLRGPPGQDPGRDRAHAPPICWPVCEENQSRRWISARHACAVLLPAQPVGDLGDRVEAFGGRIFLDSPPGAGPACAQSSRSPPRTAASPPASVTHSPRSCRLRRPGRRTAIRIPLLTSRPPSATSRASCRRGMTAAAGSRAPLGSQLRRRPAPGWEWLGSGPALWLVRVAEDAPGWRRVELPCP